MSGKLTGDSLIQKVKEFGNEEGDDKALKSRMCVECGYVDINGLPDFVGFYNALKDAQPPGRQIPEDTSMTPEQIAEAESKVGNEIADYSSWLIDQKIDQNQHPSILEKVGGRIANVFNSRFKLRLRLAKASGIGILLPDGDLLDLAEYYDDAGEDEKEVDTLSILLKRKPDQSDALFRRALSLQFLERYGDSIKDWSRLINLKSNLSMSYKNRSECKLELKDFSGAEEDAFKVFGFRINNYTAKGSLSVLFEIAKAQNNLDKAVEIQDKIDRVGQLPDGIEYIDPDEKIIRKRDDFNQFWAGYRENTYSRVKESEDTPLDIDALFRFSERICEKDDLEDWERESICLLATNEIAMYPIIYKGVEEEAALRQNLDRTIRLFIANLRRSWAEHYVQVVIEIIASVKNILENIDMDVQREKAHRIIVAEMQTDIYRAITEECESHILGMNKLVHLAKSKSPFSELPDPHLTHLDIEDGRLSAVWGDPSANAGAGRSYTYLVDFEGDAFVEEFGDSITFADVEKAPFIAATIVQDVFGQYDRENAVAMMQAFSLFGESVKDAREMNDVFNSLNKEATQNKFFQENEKTVILKAFLSAIPDDAELQRQLRSAGNPYEVIEIAERAGFAGLTPDALEKAWFGQPVIPDYLFHHFKRKGAFESTTMTLYKAEKDLERATKSDNKYLADALIEKIQSIRDFMDGDESP